MFTCKQEVVELSYSTKCLADSSESSSREHVVTHKTNQSQIFLAGLIFIKERWGGNR